MEEFVPYLLILISWHPDHPGKYSIERAPTAFATLDQCQADGNEFVAQRKIYRAEFGGMHFSFKCIQSATYEEVSQVIAEQDALKAPAK